MEKVSINCPLVSIIVITYNSGKYVMDTLESAKSQSYRNIELILTDDGSTDDTVDICRKWLDENREEFISSELITTAKNSGISANCNRGLEKSNGSWIKFIAGDDLLMPNCIHDNLDYILDQKHGKISFLFSRFKLLDQGEMLTEHLRIARYQKSRHHFEQSPRHQFLQLLTLNFVPAPSNFLHKETVQKLGGFDENFPLSEDFPFWLKATYSGIQLHFLDKETVIYRITETSLTDVVNDGFVFWYEKAISPYFNTRNKLLYPFHYVDFRLRYYHYKRRIEGLYSHYNWLKYMNPLLVYRYIANRIKNRQNNGKQNLTTMIFQRNRALE